MTTRNILIAVAGILSITIFLIYTNPKDSSETVDLLDSFLNEQWETIKNDTQVVAFVQNREAIANTPHRPLYHFSAPMGRIHDPNGLCQWQGNYHLFYQYIDTDPNTEGIRWGHAYSEDLLTWKDLPVAISPTIEQSSFSGQTLAEEDRVIAMWHGLRVGNMIATSNDPLLLDWEPNPNNPVIPMKNKQGDYQVFDPCIWKQNDGYYYSLSGSYKNGVVGKDCTGEVQAFRSKDLNDWEWIGPMFTDSLLSEPGEDMVVPNFWPVGSGKHLLLCFSHKRAGRGYVGTYDPEAVSFEADYHFRANHSVRADRKGGLRAINSGVHAPSATVDESGRYVAVFNMCDYKEQDGWSGLMTLPRVYSLAEDNSLRVNPIKELENLRFNWQEVASRELPSDQEIKLESIKGKAIEIRVVIEPRQAKEVGLKVLQSPSDSEYTVISFKENKISINNEHSSNNPEIKHRPEEAGELILEQDESLQLRIFIDRSVVEVFANERQVCSMRVFPTQESASGVSLFSRGGKAKLLSLEAWQMKSVWPELAFKEGK